MRCSRCDMPLSPTRTSCPRCGNAVVASGGFKGQSEPPFAFVHAAPEPRHQSNAGFIDVAVDVAPMQPGWGAQARSVQETPFAAASAPPLTPFAAEQGDVQVPLYLQEALASSTLPPLPQARKRSVHVGFGLAGLCTAVACVLLLFVYVMAQTLPQSSTPPTTRSGVSSLVAQNTPVIDLSPTATTPIASPTATYPGQQYIANAHTAMMINVATAQPTLPASTFKVGQKIYITFDVHPQGQTGAICLLWFINATQFTSYPFAVNTTSTTSAYSYASTGNVGPGYVEIYWENAPSCLDPNKILSDHVDFTVTA